MTAETLAERLKIDPAAEGFRFLPVKQIALDAASGTTPFDGLFLAFSFFIIASAVMLVALLFKLGIDGQGSEIGVLMALGFSRGKVRGILLAEGLIVSLLGGLVGVIGGVFYAWLMLAGLQTIWLAAVVTPFLHSICHAAEPGRRICDRCAGVACDDRLVAAAIAKNHGAATAGRRDESAAGNRAAGFEADAPAMVAGELAANARLDRDGVGAFAGVDGDRDATEHSGSASRDVFLERLAGANLGNALDLGPAALRSRLDAGFRRAAGRSCGWRCAMRPGIRCAAR